MSALIGDRPRDRGKLAVLLLAVVAVGTLVVVSSFAYERAALRARQNLITYPNAPLPSWFQIEADGILRPPTLPAEGAGMRPDEEVIGVEVGGKTRAYRISAFRDPAHHIVNDLIGGVPVSVAYCDLTDCVRVYTDPRGAAPLDVALAGLFDGQMVVKLGGVRYFRNRPKPVTRGLDTVQ